MITTLFINSKGDLEPIGDAAAQLGLTAKQLKNLLCAWENHQWQKDYSEKIGRYSYTLGEPDRFDIVTIIKRDKNQRMIIKKIFSMELTL